MKKYFISFLLLAFFFGNAAATFACLCDGKDSIEAAFNKADAVFVGSFVSAEYRKGIANQFREMEAEIDGRKIEYEVLVVRFQVINWWRGAATPAHEIILVTDQTRAADGTESFSDCDYVFKKGRKYLIYAYGKPDELGTDACSRTAELKRAKKDLSVLGKGKSPLP
jgi:hypothetical protein